MSGWIPSPRVARWLAPAALCLLAVLLTWPVALAPHGALLGHPACSAGCHAWVLWFAGARALPTGSVTTDLLFFPHGADAFRLYGSDVLGPLLLGPLNRWFPASLLYNLQVLAAACANGVAAWLLARDRGHGHGAALVAGVVYEASPFLAHELLNGTSELYLAAPLPLFLLGLLRILDGRAGVGAVALTGVAAGLGGLASAYTPFFLLLAAVVVVGHRLVGRLEPVLSAPVLQRAAAAAGLAALVLVPLLVAHRRHGSFAAYARQDGWDTASTPLPDGGVDLLAFLDPRDLVLPVPVLQPDGTVYEYWTLGTAYQGIVALGLGLYGILRRRPVEAEAGVREPWVALAVVAGLVSLGPWLVVAGDIVRIGGDPVPLPSLVLRELFPPFAVTAPHTYRYLLPAMLGVALAAAEGARRLPRPSLAVLAALLVAGESLLLSPVPWPLPTQPLPRGPAFDALSAAPRGGVLTLPFEANDLGDLSWGLLAQTVHGQPWVDGGIHFRAEPASLALYGENALLAALSGGPSVALPDAAATRDGLRGLAEAGVRHVLLARDRFPPAGPRSGAAPSRDDPAQVEAWLTHHLGPPTADDGTTALFLLPPPGDPP